MESRERILSEATELFLHRGVKAVRMDDIACRLNVSKRTIYELFGDKVSLLSECVRRFHQAQHAKYEFRVLKTQNIIESFIVFLENWEEIISVKVSFMNDIRNVYPEVFEQIRNENIQEGLVQLQEKLRSGMEDGLFFPGLNLEFTALALMSSIETVFDSPSIYDTVNISRFDAFKYISLCFFRGIATERGIVLIDKTIGKYFPTELF